MKAKTSTKSTVSYGKVRSSFVAKRAETMPSASKAGKRVQGHIVTGAATVVAGAGIAVGAVGGFIKGLFS